MKKMKVLFSALLVLNLMGDCLGSGYLDVQAVAFENPYGKDSSGKNCDYLPDLCDHKFSFCLLSGGACEPSFLAGTYWDLYYVDFGKPMAGGSTNPMRFHFRDEYPGQFSIKTVVEDEDSGSSAYVDTITISRTMSPGGDTVEVRQAGSRGSFTTYLTLRFTVRCDTNYYGERCNVYCRATHSESGHYTCGSSGEKMCLDGWTNPTQHCLTSVCRVGCDHGRCDRPGECICTEGYGGSLCNEPICKGGCGHGTCTSPGMCSCQEGFRGKSCDEAICKKGCKYGHCTNPGECLCTPGYSGDLCDQPVCDGGCGHGTCKSPGVCDCEGGYTGRNCEQAICKDRCIYGNCSKPDECLCYPGYSGTLCEKAYDICSVPDFCTNGGTCTPLGGVGQFECSCPMGYTGERCQDLVDNCVSGVCLNGGECINALNSFSCHCAQGFTGGFCEVDIDECASYPCKNGGLCVDKVSDYECVCPDTVDGTRPSKNCSGPPCMYVFCGENGTCTNVGDTAVCECLPGSTWQPCEGPTTSGDESHTKCLLLFVVAIALAIAVVGLLCLLFWRKAVPTCEYRAITKKLIRKFFTKGLSRAKDADKCPLVEDREEYGSEEGLSEDGKQFLINTEDSKV